MMNLTFLCRLVVIPFAAASCQAQVKRPLSKKWHRQELNTSFLGQEYPDRLSPMLLRRPFTYLSWHVLPSVAYSITSQKNETDYSSCRCSCCQPCCRWGLFCDHHHDFHRQWRDLHQNQNRALHWTGYHGPYWWHPHDYFCACRRQNDRNSRHDQYLRPGHHGH